jgi:uncharacterized membrane protein YkvI
MDERALVITENKKYDLEKYNTKKRTLAPYRRKNLTGAAIGLIYACSVMGVGFASGNEVLHFFTSYGMKGFYGIVAASVLYSFFGYAVVRTVYKTGADRLIDLYKAAGGQYFAGFANVTGTLFSFCLFVLMLSAWTKIWNEIVFVPPLYAYALYVLLFYLYCIFDIQSKPFAGWMRLLMLCGTGTVLFAIVAGRLIKVFSAYFVQGFGSWFLSAVFYVGYNSFVSADLLCKACNSASSEKSAVAGSIAGGAVLFVLSFLIHLVLWFWYRGTHSFPLLDMTEENFQIVRIFFAAVLLLCILYTGFNSGMIVTERAVKKLPLKKEITLLLLSLLSVLALPLGFDSLIAAIYPVFGFLGSVITVCFVVLWIVRKNR